MCITTIVLGDLCDNIGLVGVSAKWSYVTASPSQAIPILSPLFFMHVGHPYIPLFKSRRNFDLLVSPPFLAFRQVVTRVYIYMYVYAHMYNFHFPYFPRFVTTNMAGFVHVHTCTCFYCYILTFSNMMTNVIVCMLASSKLYM